MPRPLVIIHGWSDQATTFKPLAGVLAQKLGVPVTEISLAQWESTNDQVTYDDLITRMDLAWTAAKLPREPHSVDVVCHSTGSLVIRDWLLRNFAKPPAASISPNLSTPAPKDNPTAAPTADNQSTGTAQILSQTPAPAVPAPPVKNLVMLAPANFGSPLAAKGTSFIGRVVKGWNSGEMFQVGAAVLKGLELASTYSWNLALGDRFGKVDFYDVGNVLTTVLVGNAGYTGISSAANEPGSDGTVRASTANMKATYITADLTDPTKAAKSEIPSVGKTAFRVMDGLNHSTIHDEKNGAVIDAIVAGLKVDDAGFDDYCKGLDAATQAVVADREAKSDTYYWGYANVVFFVHDQFGRHVTNYFIEFYNDHSGILEELFHRKILQDTHAYSDDNAYRAMLIDTKTLRDTMGKADTQTLKISLTAEPEFSVNRVGYRTFNDKDISAIELTAAEVLEVFKPNQTTFVEVIIRREQQDNIFTFSPD